MNPQRPRAARKLVSAAIDKSDLMKLLAISAMNDAEKEELYLNPTKLGVTPCLVLSAVGLPESLVRRVLASGSCSEQLTVALNGSVPEELVSLFERKSPFDVVRRQARAKLQDRLLMAGGLRSQAGLVS